MIAKQGNRLELIRDAAYFASELTTRLEALADIEQNRSAFRDWQQSAVLVANVRSLCRFQADEMRRRARVAAIRRLAA